MTSISQECHQSYKEGYDTDGLREGRERDASSNKWSMEENYHSCPGAIQKALSFVVEIYNQNE